jgi:hypothetical protein
MSVPSIYSEVLDLLLQSVQIDVKFPKYARIINFKTFGAKVLINLSKNSYKIESFFMIILCLSE